MARGGYRSLSVREEVLRDLEDWRVTRRPLPSEGESVALAVKWFLLSDPKERDAWVENQRNDEPRK